MNKIRTFVRALLTITTEEWLIPKNNNWIRFYKRKIHIYFILSCLFNIYFLLFPKIILLPLFLLTMWLFFSTGRDLRKYDLLTPNQLANITDDNLKNILDPVAKTQGFILHGQYLSAQSLLKLRKEAEIKGEWFGS